MYKKRKIAKIFINKKIIFLSVILSMSSIGVGYATWNDDITINFLYKTGFINPIFLLNNDKLDFEDGKLTFSLSDDGYTLSLIGEVYPSFNEDITIKIIDEGTIPSIFNDFYKDDKNISDLSIYSNSKQSNNLNTNNDYIESFELNISPNSDDSKQLNETYSGFNDEILNLEQKIEILKKEINLYDKEENYEFQYILNFEQGL